MNITHLKLSSSIADADRFQSSEPSPRTELVHNEIPRRQGVIRSSLVRSPSDPPDALSGRELDQVCDRVGIGSGAAR